MKPERYYQHKMEQQLERQWKKAVRICKAGLHGMDEWRVVNVYAISFKHSGSQWNAWVRAEINGKGFVATVGAPNLVQCLALVLVRVSTSDVKWMKDKYYKAPTTR